MQYFFRKKVHRYLTDNDVRKIVENALYSNIKDCISRIEVGDSESRGIKWRKEWRKLFYRENHSQLNIMTMRTNLQKQSSRGVLYKRYPYKFHKIHRKSLRPATLSKKRLWHRCFPVNFTKCLRTPNIDLNYHFLFLTRNKSVYLIEFILS